MKGSSHRANLGSNGVGLALDYATELKFTGDRPGMNCLRGAQVEARNQAGREDFFTTY